MSTFDIEGRASAIASLAEARAIGSQFQLTHRNNSPITLYGLIIELDIGGYDKIRGRRVESGTLNIECPTGQTGFSVMSDNQRPITPGDVIQWPLASGRYWTVPNDDKAIQQLANGYVYRWSARERKTITGGVQS